MYISCTFMTAAVKKLFKSTGSSHWRAQRNIIMHINFNKQQLIGAFCWCISCCDNKLFIHHTFNYMYVIIKHN